MKINGALHCLWRAVDHESKILESFVAKKRDKSAALAFMRKALKRHGKVKANATDGLRSDLAAMRGLSRSPRDSKTVVYSLWQRLRLTATGDTGSDEAAFEET